jgi:hypothetical protein
MLQRGGRWPKSRCELLRTVETRQNVTVVENDVEISGSQNDSANDRSDKCHQMCKSEEGTLRSED